MLRDILLGVGITLIIISLILIRMDYNVQKNNSFSEEEIISLARERGMLFPGEEYRSDEIKLRRNIDLKKGLACLEREEEQKLKERLEQRREELKEKEVKLKNKEDDLIKKEKKLLKLKDNKEVLVEIPRGISSREVADLLVNKGLIKDKKAFILLLDKLDIETKIMAGRYKFNKDVSFLKMLHKLTIE